MTGVGDRITYAQAARILDCGVNNIPKLIRRGLLATAGRRSHLPSLDRAEVEQLAHDRRLAAAEADLRAALPPAAKPVPWPEVVDGHPWLTATQAAKVIGISGQAVRKRCRKGTIPHARNAAGWWIREDHVRVAAHTRATADDQGVAEVRSRVLDGPDWTVTGDEPAARETTP